VYWYVTVSHDLRDGTCVDCVSGLSALVLNDVEDADEVIGIPWDVSLLTDRIRHTTRAVLFMVFIGSWLVPFRSPCCPTLC
jgi:hypothetical protein